MSYEKQNWQTGDVITATKLNHMENGIADVGTTLIVNAEVDEQTEKEVLDKTWKEIHDAIVAGRNVVVAKESNSSWAGQHIVAYDYITEVGESLAEGEDYYLQVMMGTIYATSTENGYPAHGGR